MWGDWHLAIHLSGGAALWITAIATALLASAAWVALLSLRDAKRTRHGTLVSEFARRWESPLLTQSMEAWSAMNASAIEALTRRVYVDRRATPAERDEFVTLIALPNIVEELGVLEDEDVLDAGVIYKVWGATIIGLWEDWGSSVDLIRDETHPWTFEYFQQLAEKIREREAARWRETRRAAERRRRPPNGAFGSASPQAAGADDQTVRSSQAHSSTSTTPLTPRTSPIGTSHSNALTPTRVIVVVCGLLGISALSLIRRLMKKS